MKKKLRISPNKEIGILPPGPITNNEFFIKNGDLPDIVLKKGLILNKDYRGVNNQVWC